MLLKCSIARLENKLMKNAAKATQSTKISEMAPSTSSPKKSMETGKRQRRRIVLQMLVGRWRSYATG